MRAGLLGVALLASGCASVGTLQTANTVGLGRIEVAAEPGLHGAYGARDSTVPTFNVRGVFGLTERTDVGVRLGSTGLELLAKFQLTPEWQEDFVLSVAPTAGGFLLPDGAGFYGTAFVTLPVLVGLGVGAGHQLVLGPKLHQWLLFGPSLSHALSAGGSVGFSLRLSSTLRVLPEFAVLVPLVGSPDLTTARRTYAGGSAARVFHVGIAVLWNG